MSFLANTMRRRRRILRVVVAFFALGSRNCLISCSGEEHKDEEGEGKKSGEEIGVVHIDKIEDSLFDAALAADPSCDTQSGEDCYSPPLSTESEPQIDATCFKGGDDVDEPTNEQQQCDAEPTDPHWGSDPNVINMRDRLKQQAQENPMKDKRPPIFLIPGLASTRLVAWKAKKCSGTFTSDIRVQDNVWLNINLVVQMGTINVGCMTECLSLGKNQSDTDDWEVGCKLRADEGLDAIASLAPGGIGSNLLVGGTNTVYAWLIQWLSDNLGYDVTNIIGLPYDWRLTPDKMEERDGFLSIMRRRIEAAVGTNGHPGIMVCHSMGNVVFRYFLEWLRVEMRQEAYNDYLARARRRAQAKRGKDNPEASKTKPESSNGGAGGGGWSLPGWLNSVVTDVDEWYEWLTGEDVDVSELEGEDAERHAKLVQLAQEEGDAKWVEWLEAHVWTYVGLSSLMLGAVNPLRAVISGENMGLPLPDHIARGMELSFGSTHSMNPISSNTGFCDEWNKNVWDTTDEAATMNRDQRRREHGLACLDDIMKDIELSSASDRDPWRNFPALKALMRDRIDWDTNKPMVDVNVSHCVEKVEKNKKLPPCQSKGRISISPNDATTGNIYDIFHNFWKEDGDPLLEKKQQYSDSYLSSKVPNILSHTWDRPLIKHVILAYGVDLPTEVGYVYEKEYKVESHGDGPDPNSTEPSDMPNLKSVLWEEPGGKVTVQEIDNARGGIADVLIKKKIKREPLNIHEAQLAHSGDGSVPYLSLSWAHTWLLHAARAKRFSENDRAKNDTRNVLDHIDISHRPQGEIDWIEGPPSKPFGQDHQKLVDESDTGTAHPHGTRYKPEMIRYHNVGTSRTTGIEYTTSVIEAVGVEHKETTRNYDILAAVFSDVLKYMHDDFGLDDS